MRRSTTHGVSLAASNNSNGSNINSNSFGNGNNIANSSIGGGLPNSMNAMLNGNNSSNQTTSFRKTVLGTVTEHSDTLDPVLLTAELKMLQDDLKRREASYIARERNYELKIIELETTLKNYRKEKTNWMYHNPNGQDTTLSDSAQAFIQQQQQQQAQQLQQQQQKQQQEKSQQEKSSGPRPVSPNVKFQDQQTSSTQSPPLPPSTTTTTAAAATKAMSENKMLRFHQLQEEIIENVTIVQTRANRIIQDQERDLLKSFQSRLYNIQCELEKEKSRNDDGAIAWIEKCKNLEQEFNWAKEISSKLEEANQVYIKENNRLKLQYTTQEEDRLFLVKQVTAARKENTRLHNQIKELQLQVDNLTSQIQIDANSDADDDEYKPTSDNSNNNNNNNNTFKQFTQTVVEAQDHRFKSLNQRLKKLLAEERRALKTVRENYSNELRNRTELELLLRSCLDDVKREISLQTGRDMKMVTENLLRPLSSSNSRPSSKSKQHRVPHLTVATTTTTTATTTTAMGVMSPSSSPSSILPTIEMRAGNEERQQFLSLLFKNEKLLRLVYDQAFPIPSSIGTTATTTTTENEIVPQTDTIKTKSTSFAIHNNNNNNNDDNDEKEVEDDLRKNREHHQQLRQQQQELEEKQHEKPPPPKRALSKRQFSFHNTGTIVELSREEDDEEKSQEETSFDFACGFHCK